MFQLTHEEIQTALKHLEQAIYNHEQWYKSLIRALICHLPYDYSEVTESPHRKCLFGQWYYYNAPRKLHNYPAFIAIENEHEHMHGLASDLLKTASTDATISPLEFDKFINSLDRLRLQIYTLKRELEDLFYNLDPLTGANNRLGMLTKLRECQELVKRQVQNCSIALMDLDRFKAVNDEFGHQTGDRVLAASVGHIIENLRPYDKVFRYGGEEFLICMQHADLKIAHSIIERLREGIAAIPIQCNKQDPLHVTASFGLTELEPKVHVDQAVARADKALHAAKSAGRNCTYIWDPSM